MALLSALKCPLIDSGKRAVETAVKKVVKEYKVFCEEYFQVSPSAESWQQEGTFSISCFQSRVNIGYLIISIYQRICNENSVTATSGFASAIKQETWTAIADSLLVGGLGVASEKFEKGTLELVGKELRKVLVTNKGHLQEFLLSLLQTEELADKEKEPRKGQKRVAAIEKDDGDAVPQGPKKKARSKERMKGKVPSSLEDMHAPKAPEAEGHRDKMAETRPGVRERGDSLETDDEEIEAEADPRKPPSSPAAPKSSRSNGLSAAEENVAANAEAGTDALPDRATENLPPSPVPARLQPDSPLIRGRQATAATDERAPDGDRTSSPSKTVTTPARKAASSQNLREGLPLGSGSGHKRRASPQSKGPALEPVSPSSNRSASKQTPPRTGNGVTGPKERGGLSRKEALSKMSPNSRKRLTKKQCEDCYTWNGIRATKCSNEECGVELGNKAAKKRAAALEKKLATRVNHKKAWEQLTLAAQVLENSKPTGARISILVMKKGETVGSVQTFGLGGGQRFVSSKRVQDAFVTSMREEILEESKARRAAEKAARDAAKNATTEERTADGRAQERNAARGPATSASAGPVGERVSHSVQTLESVVYSLDQISDANKKEMMSCLEKEEFNLQTAKETTATEFKAEFPEIPFARWKALEARLSKL